MVDIWHGHRFQSAHLAHEPVLPISKLIRQTSLVCLGSWPWLDVKPNHAESLVLQPSCKISEHRSTRSRSMLPWQIDAPSPTKLQCQPCQSMIPKYLGNGWEGGGIEWAEGPALPPRVKLLPHVSAFNCGQCQINQAAPKRMH